MRPPPRAFSLLELILVLVVLGITSSVVAVRLSSLHTSQSVSQAARALEDQFGRCRHLAVTRGDLARLRLDLDAQTATVQVRSGAVFVDPSDAERAGSDLRSGVETQTLTFTGSDAQVKQTGLVDILFYPDARCSPSGSMTIAKGASASTVTWPASGRPAHAEGAR